MNHFNRIQNNSHLNNKIDHMSRNIDEILQYLKNHRHNRIAYSYRKNDYSDNISYIVNSVAKNTTRHFLGDLHKKKTFTGDKSSYSFTQDILYKGVSNTILNIFDKIW